MEWPDIQELGRPEYPLVPTGLLLSFPNGFVKGFGQLKWPIGRLAAWLPIKWSNLVRESERVGGHGIHEEYGGKKNESGGKTELVGSKSQINK